MFRSVCSVMFTSLFCALLPSPSSAKEFEIRTETETYLCGAADMKAFFVNYNKSACLGYNWTTKTGSLELTIGLGFGSGAGLEVGGWGASADVTIGQKVTVTISGEFTTQRIIFLCGDSGTEGKGFRAELLKQIKGELKKLGDEELKKVGLSKKQVEDLTELPSFDLILADKEKVKDFEKLLKKSVKISK